MGGPRSGEADLPLRHADSEADVPGDRPSSAPGCRCGALAQQSWWHEILERQEYRVVRVDHVNPVADVVTFASGDSETSDPLFFTVVDVDWAALLDNFAEPLVTRDGEEASMVLHDLLLARLRRMLLSADPGALQPPRAAWARGSSPKSSRAR